MTARAFVAKFAIIVSKNVTLFNINLGVMKRRGSQEDKLVKGSLWIAG